MHTPLSIANENNFDKSDTYIRAMFRVLPKIIHVQRIGGHETHTRLDGTSHLSLILSTPHNSEYRHYRARKYIRYSLAFVVILAAPACNISAA